MHLKISYQITLSYRTIQGQGHQSYHDKDFGDLEELLYTGLVDWILRAHAVFLYHISHNLLQFLPKEDSYAKRRFIDQMLHGTFLYY